MLELKVEIASLSREMPTGIQQYQVVGTGSPQRPRRLEAVGRIDFDAPTPQDPGANVASAVVGVDEEKLPAIENRAATKWWWLVHTALPKPERVCGKLGRIVLPGGEEVNKKLKSPDPASGFRGLAKSFELRAAAPINLARRGQSGGCQL